MKTYTLIAYRANGVQSYRGCVTDRWDSIFVHDDYLTQEQLIDKIARLRVKNQEGGAYDEILFFESMDASKVNDDTINQLAYAKVPVIEELLLENERAKEEERKRQYEREKLEAERREFERLAKKFASGDKA